MIARTTMETKTLHREEPRNKDTSIQGKRNKEFVIESTKEIKTRQTS